jgi:hypothetical protein
MGDALEDIPSSSYRLAMVIERASTFSRMADRLN